MINKEKLLMSNNSSVLDFRWRDSVSIRLWICSLLTANWLQPRPLTAITAPLAYPPMLGGLKAGDGPVLILESSILTELPSRVLTQLRLYSLFTAAEQFVKKKKNFLRDWRSSYFFNFFSLLCISSSEPNTSGWVSHKSLSSETEFITWSVLCSVRTASVPSAYHH